MRSRHSRVTTQLGPSLAPSHPGGIQRVEPSSSTKAGPDELLWLAARQLQLRAGYDLGGADGDELDLPPAVGVAVALLVRAVEALGQVAAERHGQLERLAAVAEVGLALPAAARPPRRAAGRGRRRGRAARRPRRARAPRERRPPPARARPPSRAPRRARTRGAGRRRRRRRARTRAGRVPARPRRRAARAASPRSRPRRPPPDRSRRAQRPPPRGRGRGRRAAPPAAGPSRRFASVTVGPPPRP